MSYPILTAKNADLAAEEIRDGREPDESTRSWVDGFDVDLEAIHVAASQAEAAWLTKVASLEGGPKNRDRESIDGLAARHVHSSLRHMPPQVLDDRGFWRYLALYPYRWMLAARRTTTDKFRASDYGGARQTPRGFLENHYVMKAYRRGAIAYDQSTENPYERTERITRSGERDIDVWDSHFHKSKLGAAGDSSRAIFDAITTPNYFGLHPTREMAKLLARERHNLLFDVFSYDEAMDMARAKRQEADSIAARQPVDGEG